MEYVEKRSKHALAVDRGIQAKQIHKSYTNNYKRSPNNSDVEDYDTKGKTIPPPEDKKPTPPPQKPKEKKPIGDYIPTESERKVLLKEFTKNGNPIQLHKDLLTTKNVIKDKKDVSKWKKNPNQYDIRGVDTRAKGLIGNRIETARKYAGVDVYVPKKINKNIFGGNVTTNTIPSRKDMVNVSLIRRGLLKGRMPKSSMGVFTSSRMYDDRIIKISSKVVGRTDSYTPQRVLAHEIGHAIDSKKHQTLDFGNPNKYHNIKIREKISTVLSKKITPYDREKYVFSKYGRYRESRDEQFADWFSGLITDKSVVKKDSKQFYNIFKSGNKPLFSALKKSDKLTTSTFLKNAKLGF